jgi:hypothetical protein
MPRPHLTPGKDLAPILQEAVWASGLVWTGAENLAPTGIRSPDRPARRHSLYRLSYPARDISIKQYFKEIQSWGVDKIKLFQDRLRWWVNVNM